MSVHHVTLFDSCPHLSALMPPARLPGRCRRGSGIDRALPSRAPPAPHVSAPPARSRRSPCSPVWAASLPAHPRPLAHHRHRRARPSDVAPTVRVSNHWQPASLSPSPSTSPSPSPSLSTSFSDSGLGCSCWAFRQHSAAPLGTCMPLTSAISEKKLLPNRILSN